ncbi:DUF3322 domain-containing protein [Streptomyces sp. NPDC093984]|uniref:DUF3322 domain-containing protein n=1 Tax=Streptomyces sp. NPDC093984 TaxID=3366052 RepID=UPI00381AB9A9
MGTGVAPHRLRGVAARAAADARRHAAERARRPQSPALVRWMADHPMKVLLHTETWHQLVRTACWIHGHTAEQVHLREIDSPSTSACATSAPLPCPSANSASEPRNPPTGPPGVCTVFVVRERDCLSLLPRPLLEGKLRPGAVDDPVLAGLGGAEQWRAAAASGRTRQIVGRAAPMLHGWRLGPRQR